MFNSHCITFIYFSLIASYPFNDFTLIGFLFLGGIINSTSLKRPIPYINIQRYFYIIVYKRLRWIKLTRCVGSRFRTNDSESNNDFKSELNQALDLADNTVGYVDDISIPHTWRTIESHNNMFYIILKTETVNADTTRTYDWLPYVLTTPNSPTKSFTG